MEKDRLQAFTARITQATKTELVVIMYEIILTDIVSAESYYSEGNIDMYVRELKHGQRFLNELMATLDYRFEVSYQLISLYIYVNKALITAMTQKIPEKLEEVKTVMTILLEGFKELCKQDSTGPVMQNTQQLYAGLTYGKGVLNEVYLNANEQSRGFKA